MESCITAINVLLKLFTFNGHIYTEKLVTFLKKKTILKYKSVKGKKKMASIKKVLLCPMFHVRQFTLWLRLSVQRLSPGCEVALDHAFEKSSYIINCCSSVRRNLFPHSPLVTSENS